MWATQGQAESAYATFLSGFPNFDKTSGTHLASGRLVASDGRAGGERSDGHFSFFESASADLEAKFSVLHKLAP